MTDAEKEKKFDALAAWADNAIANWPPRPIRSQNADDIHFLVSLVRELREDIARFQTDSGQFQAGVEEGIRRVTAGEVTGLSAAAISADVDTALTTERRRTRSEVMGSRCQPHLGCCNRYRDNRACLCLEEAIDDRCPECAAGVRDYLLSKRNACGRCGGRRYIDVGRQGVS